MAKYTEGFKAHAVSLLNALKEKGMIVIDSLEIRNVRQLCGELDISSYSLYEWVKVYNPKEDDNETDDELDIEDQILDGDADWFGQEKEIKTKTTGEINQIKKDAIKEFATNQRSMSTLAQALQIPNYSNMKVAQMRLAIGNELIKLSGLIDMNKAKRKLKQNGDNL